ncbi:MAG: amidase [Pseudomonadales bacterium]|nr:amidase [Pseudomonadales bacterium]
MPGAIVTPFCQCLRRVGLLLGLTLALSAQAQTSFEVTEASIHDLQIAMTAKRLTAVELVDAYLARIDAYDDNGPALNALIRLNPNARAEAAALDQERRVTGPRSPLHGIPVILKDNYNTVDMPTTGGSKALQSFVPNADATLARRLRDAGAIILGKANLHEFAYGITTISSLGGQTRNPYDLTRIPGGSSGGTAAAIAASFAAVGMGSDTCGSIRIPAAYNDLVGLRPSKGFTSIYGIMPLASTQDVAGPLARNFEDLAVVLDIVSGFDSRDPATLPMQARTRAQFRVKLGSESLAGMRIGRLLNYMDSADAPVREALDRAFAQLADKGAVIVDVRIPGMTDLLAASGVIGQEFEADLDAYLAQFGASTTLESIVASGQYDPAVATVLTRSAAGQQDPAVYQAALAQRSAVKAAIEAAMAEAEVDVLAYPPIGALPVVIGENQPGNNCSLSANSGLPALSLPVGFTEQGLPLSLELLGEAFSDEQLLARGYAVEQVFAARRAPDNTPPLVDAGS